MLLPAFFSIITGCLGTYQSDIKTSKKESLRARSSAEHRTPRQPSAVQSSSTFKNRSSELPLTGARSDQSFSSTIGLPGSKCKEVILRFTPRERRGTQFI
jgi:hypothetical protein